MFEQLKNLAKNSQEIPITTTNNSKKHENELINNFMEQVHVLVKNPDLPKNCKSHLETILFDIKQIDMIKLPIETQVKIERILSKDIPFAIDTYFSLPKAHAVSVILDNGKTAKQTLIDQLFQYVNLLSTTLQDSIEAQTQALVKIEKIDHKLATPKKDFFDL
jgi:hypothetical protein